MKLEKVINVIEDFAPPAFAESYDNVGLLVGDKDMVVSGILLTLDVIEESIDEAINRGLNLIVSHHPIIFSGLKSLTGSNMIERIVMRAIKNNIAIYAAHTNVDKVIDGVSFRMGEKLNLQNMKIILPDNSVCGENQIGLGVIGELDECMDATDFLELTKERFNLKFLKYSPLAKSKIKRVALCGGSGSSLISNAISRNADIFITGDIKYHDYFLAENKIIIVDIGHFESEQFTLDIFYDVLIKNITNFTVCKTTMNCNPVNYL